MDIVYEPDTKRNRLRALRLSRESGCMSAKMYKKLRKLVSEGNKIQEIIRSDISGKDTTIDYRIVGRYQLAK